MKRRILTFAATFVVGAIVAFGARAALHDPHTHSAPEPAPTVANATSSAAAAPHASSRGSGHETHAASETKPVADAPVNTVCAICGMKVNPKIPTETYQGKKVGFGCAACPPMFRANPDKYGPAALRNDVVED